MTALLTTPPRPRQARPLSLERLESRDVPSTVTLNISYGLGREITLSGTLSDTGNVANQPIAIGGQASALAFTNTSGHYQITLQAEGLGTIFAHHLTEESNLAMVQVTDEAPVLTSFEAIEGPNRVWTFRGTLTYHRPFETITVLFGGVPISLQGRNTMSNDDGEFQLNIQLNGQISDNGTVTAQAVSPYELLSALAMDVVHQTGT